MRTLYKILSIGLGIGLANATLAHADTVNLSGTVATTLSLVTTPNNGAGNADQLVLQGGTNNVKVRVATLTVGTNNYGGLTISVAPNQGGNLRRGAADTTDQIAYTLLLKDGGGSAVDGDPWEATGSTETMDVARGSGINKDLYIKYAQLGSMDPNTYTGALTVTVADKAD